MSRDGSGTHSLPEAPFTPRTVIESAKVNSNFSDISAALTASIAKDGQTTPTANLPMGTFKLTGMGVGSARTDSITLGQAQDQAFIHGTTGGTADAQTLTPSPAITTYVTGHVFRALIGSTLTNTGPATLQVSGISSPKSIKNLYGLALAPGDLTAGDVVELMYDGTNYILLTSRDWVPLANVTASSSATCVLSLGSLTEYLIRLDTIKLATDNVDLNFQVSIAAAYLTANYNGVKSTLEGGTPSNAAAAISADSKIGLDASVGNDTAERVNGWVHVMNPSQTAYPKAITWDVNCLSAGGVYRRTNGFARYTGGNGALDAVRFLAGSGNIESGTFRLFGRR